MHNPLCRALILLSVLIAYPSVLLAESPKLVLTPAVASPLDELLLDRGYPALAAAVEKMAPSAERDYFAGVLANRQGRLADSTRLLQGVLPALRTGNPARAAVALLALGDNAIKTFHYSEASTFYQELTEKYLSELEPEIRASIKDDYATIRLLKETPAQTVTFAGPVDLPTQRNPTLDTIELQLDVNGVKKPWLLDTGANFSTITKSFAQRLGVKLSQEKAQTQGITGAENALWIAVVPELKVGGATLRNVVLLVLEDSSLTVELGKDKKYTIDAILGYPVLNALSRVTFAADGRFLAGPESPSAEGGAPLWMELLTPLVQCQVQGRELLFVFDSGADHTFFSDHYYREFPEQFAGLKKERTGMAGAGGVKVMDVYRLKAPQLQVGQVKVTLKDIAVWPKLNTHQDRTFGNLGRDSAAAYDRFTIDFENMRFMLGKEKAK